MELFKHSYLSLLLLNLLREEKEEGMYGYQICQVVKERSNGQYQLKEGTLYPLLHQLEKSGIIKGYWKQVPPGPGRKYYRFTPKGEKLLEQENKTLVEFVKLVQVKNV